MIDFFHWSVVALFALASITLAVYGLHLYALVFYFRRRVHRVFHEQNAVIDTYELGRSPEDWPIVTTQLPIYDERDVAERVMVAAAAMEYPAGRHEIQVLDDSDDATRAIVDLAADRLVARGIDIKVIRRTDRDGYKAGALANGARTARGEFIAVFDADFLPPGNFLLRSVPLLASSPDLACLQGRWSHLNRMDSWLTEAQALGIDGHFAIEQGARAWNGLMMNFNGTAGVWRRAAIEDPNVGGWQGDTLTEDLDLSYRAQLAGWRLDYSLELACPAELPATIGALKSQQRRWATGSIQVARKLLSRIWRSPESLCRKIEATLHLTHYSVSIWMLILAIVARPVLLASLDAGGFEGWFGLFWAGVILSAMAPSLTYAYARYVLSGHWWGIRTIPSMVILGCGMCVNNSIAVIRGMLQWGGEFVRTPKSGSSGDARRPSSYQAIQNRAWIAEVLLGLYALLTFSLYLAAGRWFFSVFLLVYAAGFLAVGWMSRPKRTKNAIVAGPVHRLPMPVLTESGA